MQTTAREKFFNYLRMTSKLFKALLALIGLRIYKTRACRIEKRELFSSSKLSNSQPSTIAVIQST